MKDGFGGPFDIVHMHVAHLCGFCSLSNGQVAARYEPERIFNGIKVHRHNMLLWDYSETIQQIFSRLLAAFGTENEENNAVLPRQ
jgi:hypothetical protein